MKKAFRYNEELTKKAIEIFGDIVKKAYVTTWDYGTLFHDSDTNKKRVESRLLFVIPDFYDKPTIPYSGRSIWVEFKNGKVVDFKSSSMATIENAATEKCYEL